MNAKPTVLITGASAGIGSVYADRFARRGHALVLVARDGARLNALAARLRAESRVDVDVLAADLAEPAGIEAVEARLRDDARIGILVNNAGAAARGGFTDQTPGDVSALVSLNVVSLTRLSRAISPRLAQAGSGAIINLGSVVGLAPELGMSVYGATKAFVLFLSQGLHAELGPKGVYVQAVLPSVTRTELWERAGLDLNAFPTSMTADELVDAALVGFDRRETVTIPSLPEIGQWLDLEAARKAMLPNLVQQHAAKRYESTN
ncbi:MAG: SDR family oxidoreductase [Gammaproteobacteria bacterium]|nr:SDR family oxidoreductase [Gammaproteobacteria bacterium]MDE2262583.1 SDR family oxidoreductase [Gammaproteobacteria bacterium]